MNSVDQKLAEATALLTRSPALFRRQGAVVATWRRVAGRAHGPYYSLRYRDQRRQRSHYLGRCELLAAAVRNRLARLQRPRRTALRFAKLRAAVQASLRRQKQALRAQLERELGLTLKGFEVRKLRRPKINETHVSKFSVADSFKNGVLRRSGISPMHFPTSGVYPSRTC